MEKIRPIASRRDGATHTPYGWLYAFEDLIDVQCSEGQVCWITPNPYAYALQPKVKKAIQDKIGKGATYTFLVNRQFRESAKDELRRIATCDRRPIEVFEIPDKDFHELAVTDYVVVTDRDSNTRVFLELPLAHDVGTGGRAPGFWIEVFKEVAAGFLDRTKRLTGMATPSASPPPGEAAAPGHGNTTSRHVN